MFTIFLSIVFTTCILAAPAPAPAHNNTSIQWSKFKEDKTLHRFQSTLLNETVLPFLDECYTNKVVQKTKDFICSRYFDAIVQLNSTNFVVDIRKVIELRDQVNTTTTFCQQKHNYPDRKSYLISNERDLNRQDMCGKLCLQDDFTTPKPICRFLVWMGEEIRNHTIDNSKHVPVVLAPAVSTVDAPIQVSQIDHSSNVSPPINELTGKIDDAGQGKTTETLKTDAIAEKPALNVPKRPTKIPESKIPVEPIKNEAAKGVEVDLTKQKEEKQSSTEGRVAAVDQSNKKEEKQSLVEGGGATADLINHKEDKQSLDEGKEATSDLNSQKEPKTSLDGENESAFDSPNQKEEKKDSYEGKDDIPNAQDEQNKLLKQTDENGFRVDTDDDSEIMNELDPENDQIHSDKEEIINSKIIETGTTIEKKDPFHEQSGSNFFTYFLVGMFLCIAMYVFYHNKSKILALVLEGRRGDKGRNGRRKHTAAYRKLDSNLEEAITSSARGRTTQIIY